MQSDKALCLTILDHLILLTVITPLVVAFWWGTWTLLDVCLYPDDVIKRSIVTTLIACLGMTSFYCLQDVFVWFNERNTNFVCWFIFNNIYIIAFAFCNVCHWHGIWTFGAIAIDKAQAIHNNRLLWTGLFLAIVLFSLTVTRTMKSVIAPPVICAVDINPELYRCPIRFQQKWGSGRIWFLLDCCFSVLLIHSLVPLFWMTVWTVLDIHLDPLDFMENSLICLVLGTFLTLLTYLLQLPVSKACRVLESKKSHWIFKTTVDQLFHMLGATAAVTTWRGWWLIYAKYIQIGSSEVAGPWLGSAGGLLLLMWTLCGSSVHCKGVSTDGDFQEGEGGILSTHYFRYFMERRPNSDKNIEAQEENSENHPV